MAIASARKEALVAIAGKPTFTIGKLEFTIPLINRYKLHQGQVVSGSVIEKSTKTRHRADIEMLEDGAILVRQDGRSPERRVIGEDTSDVRVSVSGFLPALRRLS